MEKDTKNKFDRPFENPVIIAVRNDKGEISCPVCGEPIIDELYHASCISIEYPQDDFSISFRKGENS